jgi:hypothetical protein
VEGLLLAQATPLARVSFSGFQPFVAWNLKVAFGRGRSRTPLRRVPQKGGLRTYSRRRGTAGVRSKSRHSIASTK